MRIEETEIRIVASRANEIGAVGKLGRASEVTNRRALEADEALMRRRRLVVDFETDWAKQTHMTLEHAISAESPENPPLTDVMEEENVLGAAAPALHNLLSLHRLRIESFRRF